MYYKKNYLLSVYAFVKYPELLSVSYKEIYNFTKYFDPHPRLSDLISLSYIDCSSEYKYF